jgi:hypothetical protein
VNILSGWPFRPATLDVTCSCTRPDRCQPTVPIAPSVWAEFPISVLKLASCNTDTTGSRLLTRIGTSMTRTRILATLCAMTIGTLVAAGVAPVVAEASANNRGNSQTDKPDKSNNDKKTRLTPNTTTTTPTTTSTTTTAAPTTTTTAPLGSDYMLTPEGTVIEIDSAGDWTAEQVYQLLLESGLDDQIGPSLTVRVQDVYPSSAATGASTSGGVYVNFNAVLYLSGVNSSFVSNPASVLSHEFGHVWTLHHYYLAQQADWETYLEARGLTGDPRLDSAYHWTVSEIIADDYRLLFGSPDAIAQRPTHLNPEILDPRKVPGLSEFLRDSFAN